MRRYPHKCRTKNCRGSATKSGHSPYCSKCRSRRFAERHPLKYAFKNLRHRARQRGHDFGLSFDEFARFAVASGWLEKKGRTKECLSIDRINDERGYFADNIQVLTVSENLRKRYVPFFKNKEQERAAIAEAEERMRLEMQNHPDWSVN